jgi:glycosyltransferase involved in cell wall biosynthesis
MRIAVNTRLLLKDRLEGIGWFSYQTLQRIARAHPEHEFFFLFDRPFSADFVFSSNVTPLIVLPPTRHPVLWYLWFEYALPLVFRKIRPDFFLSPDGYLPLQARIPLLPVIHDINFVHRPGDLPSGISRYYNHFFPKFAQKATRIATVSEYSKADISTSFGIDPEKIDVVYNGSHELYTPIDSEQKRRTRERFTGGKEYFIFVGALHPRKNLPSLLQAFDLFQENSGGSHCLVIVGDSMFKSDSITRVFRQMKYGTSVVWTGRQEPESLRNLLGAAQAMVFVPLFEGFGIPMLEAMHAEIPLICSNVTSLPEIAGEAALFVPPLAVSEIAGAMKRMVSDPMLRETLIRKGKIQREKFSWDRTAAGLWASMEKCWLEKIQ